MWSYQSLLAILLIAPGLAAAPTGDSCATCLNGNCLGPETVTKTMLNGPVAVLTVTERLSASSNIGPFVVIASPTTITITPTVTLFASEAVTPAVVSSDAYEETNSGAATSVIAPDPAFATFDSPNTGQPSSLPTGNNQDADTATQPVASDNIVGINSTTLPPNLDADSASTPLAPYRWTNTTSQDRSDGTGVLGSDGLATGGVNAISSSMSGTGGSTSFPINTVDTAGASAAPQDGIETTVLASTASSGFTVSNSLTPVSSDPSGSSIIPRPADSASSPGPAQITNTGLVSTTEDPPNVSDTAASVDTSLPVSSQASTSSLSTLGESPPTLPGLQSSDLSNVASALPSSSTSSSLLVTTFPEHVTTFTHPVDIPTSNSSFTGLAQAGSTVTTNLAPTKESALRTSASGSIGSFLTVTSLTTLTSVSPNVSGESTSVSETTTRTTSNVETSDTGSSPTTTSLIGSQGLAPSIPSTTDSSSFGGSSMTATTDTTSPAASSPSVPSSPPSPVPQESRLILVTTSTEASLPGSPSPSSNKISGNSTSTVPDSSFSDASFTPPSVPIPSELTGLVTSSSASPLSAPSATSSMSVSTTNETTTTLGGSVSSFSTSIAGNSSSLNMSTVASISHATQTITSNTTSAAIATPPQMTRSDTSTAPSAATTASASRTNSTAIADSAATDLSAQTNKLNNGTTSGLGTTPTTSMGMTSASLTPTPVANSSSTSTHTTALDTSSKTMNTAAAASETSSSTVPIPISSTVSSNSGAESTPASSTLTTTSATASVAVSIPTLAALTNSNFTLRATVLTGPQTASNSLYATIVTSTTGTILTFNADGQTTSPDKFYLDGSGRLVQSATSMVAVQALSGSSGHVIWVADSAAASYAAVACSNAGGVLQCTVGGLPATQYICPVGSSTSKVALRLYTASTGLTPLGTCSPVTVSVTTVG